MKFIDIVAGDFSFRTVACHSVPDVILNNQHTDLFQLIAQFLNVKADDTILQVNIRSVIEQILRAVDIHFKRVCYTKCDFSLLDKSIVQIGQNRHFFSGRLIPEKIHVDGTNASVNDRTFLRSQSILAAHNDLTKRNDKIRLCGDRILIHVVFKVNVHGIDILF